MAITFFASSVLILLSVELLYFKIYNTIKNLNYGAFQCIKDLSGYVQISPL